MTDPITPPPALEGEALLGAYMGASYSYFVDGRKQEFRIGQATTALAELMATLGVDEAAFVTACNPPCLPTNSVHNEMAMRALRNELRALRLKDGWILDGQGGADDDSWLPEPSYLVLGVSKAEADRLGRKYGQNAVVWIDKRGMPSLLQTSPFATSRRRRLNPYFQRITLSVPWGYELASLRMTSSQWRRILEGATLSLSAWGYDEGERLRLTWQFSEGQELTVESPDAGTAFTGSIAEGSLLFDEPR